MNEEVGGSCGAGTDDAVLSEGSHRIQRANQTVGQAAPRTGRPRDVLMPLRKSVAEGGVSARVKPTARKRGAVSRLYAAVNSPTRRQAW